MATKAGTPQITALLKAVEKEFGRPVRTPSDFVLVADKIESKVREHISDSTIKRLWKPALGYDTISDRTLNVLSRYVGFTHYWEFVAYLSEKGLEESEMVGGEECIKASDLSIGDIVSFAWMPDRECRVKYLGERRFEAVECRNSKLQAGDTFYCSTFIRGRGLYVDNLTHGDTVFESYGMGTEHGLTKAVLEKH